MKKLLLLILFASMIMILLAGCVTHHKAETGFTHVVKMIPSTETTIYYYNLSELKHDKNLYFIYLMETSSEDLKNVKTMAVTNHLAIMIGNFNESNLTKSFKENLCSIRNYKGFKVAEGDRYITAYNSTIKIFGDYPYVIHCVDVTKHHSPSIYDSNKLRELLNNLPEGPCMVVTTPMFGDSHAVYIGVSMKSYRNKVVLYGAMVYTNEKLAKIDMKKYSNYNIELKREGSIITFSKVFNATDFKQLVGEELTDISMAYRYTLDSSQTLNPKVHHTIQHNPIFVLQVSIVRFLVRISKSVFSIILYSKN